MKNLNKYTPTELLKMSNDICEKHEALKKEIIANSYEIEELEYKIKELEKVINEKTQKLEQFEKNYVELIEKIKE